MVNAPFGRPWSRCRVLMFAARTSTMPRVSPESSARSLHRLALDCGSASSTMAAEPSYRRVNAAARYMALVVLATPPLAFAMVMIMVLSFF